MSWHRIKAIFLRYFYFFAKMDHLCELFYWPALELFIWGIASVWFQNLDEGGPRIALIVLTGLVFWHIIWRGNYEVSVNLLQEFWNRNLMNLFSTPLKMSEWIVSLMLVGLCKICITVTFGSLVVWILYSLNVFTIGWAFLPYAVSLTVFGWFVGFLGASIIVYFGQRVQMVAWMIGNLFAPFSAVFYPLSALPEWGQTVACFLPSSYIFEGMRATLQTGQFSMRLYLVSVGMNLLYLTLSVLLFRYSFEKSRNKGLGRLE